MVREIGAVSHGYGHEISPGTQNRMLQVTGTDLKRFDVIYM